MKTQEEGGHLHAKGRGFRRNQLCQQFDLGLLALPATWKESHPACGTLSGQPWRINMIITIMVLIFYSTLYFIKDLLDFIENHIHKDIHAYSESEDFYDLTEIHRHTHTKDINAHSERGRLV